MTQHHHTPPPDPMPLDPEERALAARLARLGPHGEPSPALDARVLAAAHAATSGGAARLAADRRARERGWRRARWPVGVGVAASVLIAAGIAWQMRPLPAPVARTAPMAPPAPASPARVAGDAGVAQPSPVPPPPPQMQPFASGETAAAPAKPQAARAMTAKRLPAPPEEPAIVFDAPSPVDAQAPLPSPPAPPAPPAAVFAAKSAAQQAQAARVAAGAPAAAAAAAATDIADDDADAPEADVPPATAASPEVRDAWLARIRELAAAGRDDEARASLAEFRRRYPAFAIPEDLRPLMPAPSTPSPSPQP